MVNRTVLGAMDGTFGLKVSKPGFDVLTSTGKQLVFDSRWTESLNLLMSGEMTVPSGGATLYFGQTLPYIPVVWVAFWGQQIPNWWSSTYVRLQVTTSSVFFVSPTQGTSVIVDYHILRSPVG